MKRLPALSVMVFVLTLSSSWSVRAQTDQQSNKQQPPNSALNQLQQEAGLSGQEPAPPAAVAKAASSDSGLDSELASLQSAINDHEVSATWSKFFLSNIGSSYQQADGRNAVCFSMKKGQKYKTAPYPGSETLVLLGPGSSSSAGVMMPWDKSRLSFDEGQQEATISDDYFESILSNETKSCGNIGPDSKYQVIGAAPDETGHIAYFLHDYFNEIVVVAPCFSVDLHQADKPLEQPWCLGTGQTGAQ